METQKIVNLLNDTDNDNLQDSQQESGMSLMIKIIQNMLMEIMMIQTLSLRQKLSNQVYVIIQMHIFL